MTRRRNGRRARRALVALLVLAGCVPALGQRMVVCTNTVSATREAARVYLHRADLDSASGVPLTGEVLPGVMPLSPIVVTPDATKAAIVSGRRAREDDSAADCAQSYVSSFSTSSFEATPGTWIPAAEGWRQVGACIARDPASLETLLVVPAARVAEDGQWQGKLDVYQCNPETGSASADSRIEWALPGAPVAAVALAGESRVAVLCRGVSGMGALLHVRNVVTGVIEVDKLDFTDERDPFNAYPSGLALSGNGRYLFALTSGYALDRPSGETASWLHAVETESFAEEHAPVEVPGLARTEDAPLQAAGSATCWIATQAPGTEFVYASCVTVSTAGLTRQAQVPFTGASQPLRIAPAPEDDSVAVAIDNRLEIRPHGQRAGRAASYDAAVNVLRWTSEGLLLGEGGRVHRVDPASGRPIRTLQFQTGLVADVAVIPPAVPGTDRESMNRVMTDQDGDGIADAFDPEPAMASPWLILPGTVTFRGEAVGRELHALVIDPAYGEKSSWEILYDKGAMPWLVIYPTRGSDLPSVVYMGVDPVQYARGLPLHGTLEVRVTGTRRGAAAKGSPARVDVQVTPERGGVRRILWVWDETATRDALRGPTDPHRLRALADLLAAPPHCFSHREAAGPFLENLNAYTVVVVTAAAASRGALTSQDVLDYVAGGGAVLFLGEYLPEYENRTLLRWLRPIGIQLNTALAVNGVFPADRTEGLARHWRDVRIEDGCDVRADTGAIVGGGEGGPDQAVLAARAYGYGRIAVLAAATPLESAAMQTQENKRFAEDLFGWLAQAGREIEDMDGDGLTDDTEDRNRNGVREPAETDYLKPDTDGDGIPDGMEDRNRNGEVDEGETDPLNPDSDGDGIFDGADAWPLPPVDAPQVVAIEPNHGPSEGGTRVTITGRNLTPGTVFWFGERIARKVEHIDAARVTAETPRYDGAEGEGVDMRVQSAQGGPEGILPDAFRYAGRSTVRLVARAQARPPRTPGHYEGTVDVVFECGPDVALGRSLFFLKATPEEGFSWGPPTLSPGPADPERRVTWHPMQTAGAWINALGGRGQSKLATIPWKIAASPEWKGPLQFSMERAHVTAANGTPLNVVIENAVARLGTGSPRPQRLPAPE